MEFPDYPPNSDVSKRKPVTEDKNIKRVTSADPVRRKKPLRKQFAETFIGGDAKTALNYMIFDVVIPGARDMVVDTAMAGLEKLIFGDSRRRPGSTRPQSGPTGVINYRQYQSPSQPSPQRVLSRRARARHDFDEIVLQSRPEAEEVIQRLYDLVSRYESASVADLYELVGLSGAFTDQKWGWRDLRGSGVSRVRDGYLLDLPEPEPLD